MTAASIDLLALFRLVPRARPLYRQAFDAYGVLAPFGVLDSVLRTEHFLAQILHESNGMRTFTEDLSYSAPRLMEVWPRRFRTIDQAAAFAHNPRKLANYVYGDRLGNTEPNDGWTFIGRGFLQLTGRENYARIGTTLGVDLIADPDLVLLPPHSLRIAGAIWDSHRCNAPADLDDVAAVTKAINGGHVGLDSRARWLAQLRRAHVVVTNGEVI